MYEYSSVQYLRDEFPVDEVADDCRESETLLFAPVAGRIRGVESALFFERLFRLLLLPLSVPPTATVTARLPGRRRPLLFLSHSLNGIGSRL